MPRAKSRNNVDMCGDCGALDASWASINKGILLCTECCSVHRSLGRQISQVKHLVKSHWPGYQLQMLQALNNNGANNIWEHSLLENGSKLLKRKPTAKDPLNVKQEFIKAKHEQLAYAFRDNYETGSAENELGKQLHASVRTSNLEASFRLLASGADPNYFHDEKGNTPLHVAVKNQQRFQIELLLAFGADPSYPDARRSAPFDLAKELAWKDLAKRLQEAQYDVTDTFSNYLCMKKPDHGAGIHFLIPPIGFKSNPTSLAKLQKLSNNVFEELVMDVYDEVDRRETEAIWLGCADTTQLSEIPFLPVDSTLSSTRNQGRQKLARFTTPDFKSLVYDILIDTQRRQLRTVKGFMPNLREYSQVPDEDPVYDSVASDDDYELVPGSEDGDVHDKSKELDTMELENAKKRRQIVAELTDQLRSSDNTITELKGEVSQLRKCLKTLQNENFELKSQLSLQNKNFTNHNNGDCLDNNNDETDLRQKDETDLRQKVNKVQRPTSMFEPREGLGKLSNWHNIKQQNKLNNNQPKNPHNFYDCDDRKKVLECTEQITRSIQNLCKSIQEPERGECPEQAVEVKLSIVKLSSNLPENSDLIRKMIELANRLEPECAELQLSKMNNDNSAFDVHYNRIREVAFHLAKFTKEIVTKYSTNA
ncbi:unnamed protein product [Brassicogethes aeneus]|uniref:Arf-GAP domain-containing protein n=1 Tax=Brassicogethes aeneus TaxID=1431903 RepID=A0A9P0B4Z3_BRAAE|nr:unnamed protein product [Brassicogethes aeneus]